MTPLIAIASILAIGCLGICGIGGWFYTQVKSGAQPAQAIAPEIVAELEGGWKSVKLESVGLTLGMPGLPERDDSLTGEQKGPSIYEKMAAFRAVGDDAEVIVIALTNKFAVFNAEDEAGTFIDNTEYDSRYSNIVSSVVSGSCAGKTARVIDLSYTYDGTQERCKVMVFLDGPVTYYIQVFATDDGDLDRVFKKATYSVVIHNPNSSVKKKN